MWVLCSTELANAPCRSTLAHKPRPSLGVRRHVVSRAASTVESLNDLCQEDATQAHTMLRALAAACTEEGAAGAEAAVAQVTDGLEPSMRGTGAPKSFPQLNLPHSPSCTCRQSVAPASNSPACTQPTSSSRRLGRRMRMLRSRRRMLTGRRSNMVSADCLQLERALPWHLAHTQAAPNPPPPAHPLLLQRRACCGS